MRYDGTSPDRLLILKTVNHGRSVDYHGPARRLNNYSRSYEGGDVMGMAVIIGVVVIVLAIVAVMLWGAYEAITRVSRFLWRLLKAA